MIRAALTLYGVAALICTPFVLCAVMSNRRLDDDSDAELDAFFAERGWGP